MPGLDDSTAFSFFLCFVYAVWAIAYRVEHARVDSVALQWIGAIARAMNCMMYRAMTNISRFVDIQVLVRT